MKPVTAEEIAEAITSASRFVDMWKDCKPPELAATITRDGRVLLHLHARLQAKDGKLEELLDEMNAASMAVVKAVNGFGVHSSNYAMASKRRSEARQAITDYFSRTQVDQQLLESLRGVNRFQEKEIAKSDAEIAQLKKERDGLQGQVKRLQESNNYLTGIINDLDEEELA